MTHLKIIETTNALAINTYEIEVPLFWNYEIVLRRDRP